jgi:hypothetical protein
MAVPEYIRAEVALRTPPSRRGAVHLWSARAAGEPPQAPVKQPLVRTMAERLASEVKL